MKNKVQALNYCVHAIEDLKRLQLRVHTVDRDLSTVLEIIIDALSSSVKFIMPNCGDMLSSESLTDTHLDLLHLPYPVTAFETPWQTGRDGMDGIDAEVTSTKRIALCWELNENLIGLFPVMDGLLDLYPAGGVFVYSVFWNDETREWCPTNGGCLIPNESRFLAPNDKVESVVSARVRRELEGAGLAKEGGRKFNVEPISLFPSLDSQDKEKLEASILVNTRDEVALVVQACSVINCANVHTEVIEPPEKLNRKRQANGKQPLFSYNVLQLGDDKNSSSERGTGASSSPRTHLRRGHLRRQNGKVIWVRATMVNPHGSGFASKDYAV